MEQNVTTSVLRLGHGEKEGKGIGYNIHGGVTERMEEVHEWAIYLEFWQPI